MDNISKLIDALKEAKEDLAKNVNMSYAGPANMSSGAASADMGKMDPEAANKVASKPQPEKVDKDMRATTEKSDKEEYLEMFKNGQWEIKASPTKK
jgi:hypothetical protein